MVVVHSAKCPWKELYVVEAQRGNMEQRGRLERTHQVAGAEGRVCEGVERMFQKAETGYDAGGAQSEARPQEDFVCQAKSVGCFISDYGVCIVTMYHSRTHCFLLEETR